MCAWASANPTHTAPAVVEVAWLAERLDDPALVILDAAIGPARKVKHRIVSARRFDIDHVMSNMDSDLPHTLPDRETFTAACQQLGIGPDNHIVVYDPQGTYSSPRARWMLNAAGHKQVSVLNGGLPAWQAAGGPVEPWSMMREPVQQGSFIATAFADAVVSADEVKHIIADRSATVIDARSRGRFIGIEPEPRNGLRSGHIPGSINLPFTKLLSNGKLRHPADLRTEFISAAVPAGPVVVTCGSGVTACIIGLAAELLGRSARLYDGSWSEWGRPGAHQVAIGDR